MKPKASKQPAGDNICWHMEGGLICHKPSTGSVMIDRKEIALCDRHIKLYQHDEQKRNAYQPEAPEFPLPGATLPEDEIFL